MENFYRDKVLNGTIKVRKVFETENVLAYHHTKPSYPVHIVVIPKSNIDSILNLDEGHDELIIEMLGVIKMVASKVVEEHGKCRIVTNLGEYQDSKHLHWHIISGSFQG